MFYTFIQQKNIKLTKSDSKDFYMLQKINISNSVPSIHQRILA